MLERALRYAPDDIGRGWRARVYSNLALAYHALEDNRAAIEAAGDALRYADKGSSTEYEAKSIILQAAHAEKANANLIAELTALEESARNKGFTIVANNIALDLARRVDEAKRRDQLRRRVLDGNEDDYNRLRAMIAKADDLIKAKRYSELTLSDRRLLSAGYSYLYTQRLGNLFERCHHVLWDLLTAEERPSLLLRLFRYSSFLWRVFGRTKRETDYIRQLSDIVTAAGGPEVFGETEDVQYYRTRLKAAGM